MRLRFSKVKQADQRSFFDHVLEERLGRIVGRDTGGQNAAGATAIVHDAPHRLAEHRIEVDVAAPAERVAAGVPEQATGPVAVAYRFCEVGV